MWQNISSVHLVVISTNDQIACHPSIVMSSYLNFQTQQKISLTFILWQNIFSIHLVVISINDQIKWHLINPLSCHVTSYYFFSPHGYLCVLSTSKSLPQLIQPSTLPHSTCSETRKRNHHLPTCHSKDWAQLKRWT